MQIPIDILLGKANAKVTKYAFENLPTFGKGTDHSSDWWKALFWMLVEEQLIIEEIKSSDNPPIKFKTYAANLPQALPWLLTDPTLGLSTLKPLSMQPSALLLEQDGKTTSLSSPSRYAAAKASGFTATPAEEALFRRLRDFRSAQAMQRSVPSYLIFHDITLRQIARFVHYY
jgi:ATP-dependent DNA helicase RecQ